MPVVDRDCTIELKNRLDRTEPCGNPFQLCESHTGMETSGNSVQGPKSQIETDRRNYWNKEDNNINKNTDTFSTIYIVVLGLESYSGTTENPT